MRPEKRVFYPRSGERESVEIQIVRIRKPDDVNFILGQAHFIKTVEDIHEAVVQTVPGILFGLAFCEASGPRLVRTSGTDAGMKELASENALAIGSGHAFVLFLKNAFPINILPVLRQVPEVCSIFCATSNQAQVIVGKTDQGNAILGVVDGQPPLGVEDGDAVRQRQLFLRKIGYKAFQSV
jgi:adenosine/AMP kinase